MCQRMSRAEGTDEQLKRSTTGVRGSRAEGGREGGDGDLDVRNEQMPWDTRVKTGRTRGAGHLNTMLAHQL